MGASLRDLTRKPVSRRAIWETVFRAAQHGDIRSAVIVNTALIDKGLERLIKSRLYRLNSQDRDAIFGATGSLGTLPAKIRMAFALGIIGPRTRADLLAINDIRNIYAHSIQLTPFGARAFRQKRETIYGFRVVMQMLKRGMTEFTELAFLMRDYKKDRVKMRPHAALVIAIGLYAIFVGSDPQRRMPPPRKKTSFMGFQFSPLSA